MARRSRAVLTPIQLLLCGQIRAALKGRGTMREVQMFGGLSFLIDEKMIVAAQKNGDLLVRIDPKKSSDLLCRPDTRQGEMGKGRLMGPSWLVAEGPLNAAEVRFWTDVAMESRAG